MGHDFCPGYAAEPFASLVRDYPGDDVYPAADFRTEWGPMFHRGRLDGTAKVLVLGQDPATHESITRRILVGEAGQRVQGLLAHLGITTSYVLVNTFVYSVYGQGGGSRHAKDQKIAEYRNRWLDGLLVDTETTPESPGPAGPDSPGPAGPDSPGPAGPERGPSQLTAVISLGDLAKSAYQQWESTQPDAAARLHHAPIRHPTYPESSSRTGTKTLAQATAELLANWNEQLPGLREHLVGDQPAAPGEDGEPYLYGTTWREGDLAVIPEVDLPAGCPAWMRSLRAWAARQGDTPNAKRANITVTIPKPDQTWPPVS